MNFYAKYVSYKSEPQPPEGAFVDVLQYNPVNFQELDNLLIDYDLSIENIFAVLA